MSFRLAASLTAIVCVILFPILLLAGSSYLATYGVSADGAAVFMARRAAPTLLGLGVLLWLARGAEPSAIRKAISIGVIVTFAGIAATGIYEYVLGIAHWVILVAAFGELIIASVFARFLRD